ncbi:hypothetical protein I350_06344 [Cryptococcus amylolentus CBS 6273]|uniref:Hexosyltransferase n=1 Tax=Cryptococcus amylolentus CBS 6273 TaxID=1296118 RepID=A0A1E3JKX9_9TREE|nr:hypothetical protein I350_06344 [Cryptococcus amylolentus CBS 6273]
MGSPANAYPSRPGLKHFLQHPHHLLRPSIRLKTSLYTLTLLIVLFLVLALNAATSGPSTSERNISRSPKLDTPADTGEGKDIAQGKDAHLVDGDIQRSFEEPDFALLSGRQPHEIGCNVPLEGEDSGVLIFLGIFSAADKRGRRDLYRKEIIPDFPEDLVTVKFILGTPPFPNATTGPEIEKRDALLRDVRQEMKEHGDMVMLPMIDNIDLGKTHEYFKYIAHTYAGPSHGLVAGRPRFVVKADDDTILVMPNLIAAFKDLDCSKNVYWGTSAGRSHFFGDYFRGLAYAMSWPLASPVSWIGSADMTFTHIAKIEDARTGQWLRHLDPVTDPIKRIDMGWTMGDWNQLDVSIETVALHWCKLDDWVWEQHARLLDLWAQAGRQYTPENGVLPKESREKGKIMPEKAEKEQQRQKEMGWDVQGKEMGWNVHGPP